MKVWVAFLVMFVLFGLVRCNSVNDIQPPDDEVAPEVAVSAIKARYPLAQAILFKTLIRNKLWRANFKSNAKDYETLVNETAIVAPVLRISSDSLVFYKDLVSKFGIAGGQISDIQVVEGDVNHAAVMKYTLNGKLYRLDYSILYESHEIRLTAPFAAYSRVLTPEEVPAKFKEVFSSLTDYVVYELIDENGLTSYRAYEKRDYRPNPFFTPICFDKDYNLTWIGRNSDSSGVTSKPNSEVGTPELLAKFSKGMEKFDINTLGAYQTNFNGLLSIRYAFSRRYTDPSFRTSFEFWQILVNPTSEKAQLEEYAGYFPKE